MFYRKNLPAWERVARVLGGAAMVACGLVGLPGLPIGYLIAGFIGACILIAVARAFSGAFQRT